MNERATYESFLNELGFTLNSHSSSFPRKIDTIQEEAIFSLSSGNNLVFVAPVGSGKSLPALVHLLVCSHDSEQKSDFIDENVIKPPIFPSKESREGVEDSSNNVYFYSQLDYSFSSESSPSSSQNLENQKGLYTNSSSQKGQSRFPSLWLCPYKSLVKELYSLCILTFPHLRENIGISTSDSPLSYEQYTKYKVVFATYESLAFLINQSESNLIPPRFVVLDECQIISEPKRGSVIEQLIILFKRQKVQLCALSGTLSSPQIFASWIKAKLLLSKKEPTLRHYIPSSKLSTMAGIWQTISSYKERGPVFVFLATRKRCRQFAELYLQYLLSKKKEKRSKSNFSSQDFLSPFKDILSHPQILESSSDNQNSSFKQLVSDLKTPSLLQDMIKEGIAFHHAGLNQWVRSNIELLFKRRQLDVLFCTPTLSAGVNLPVRTLILLDPPDLYSKKLYSFHQLAGRVARRQYWKDGFIVLSPHISLHKYFQTSPFSFDSQLLHPLSSTLLDRLELQLYFIRSLGQRSIQYDFLHFLSLILDTLWWHQFMSRVEFKISEETLDALLISLSNDFTLHNLLSERKNEIRSFLHTNFGIILSAEAPSSLEIKEVRKIQKKIGKNIIASLKLKKLFSINPDNKVIPDKFSAISCRYGLPINTGSKIIQSLNSYSYNTITDILQLASRLLAQYKTDPRFSSSYSKKVAETITLCAYYINGASDTISNFDDAVELSNRIIWLFILKKSYTDEEIQEIVNKMRSMLSFCEQYFQLEGLHNRNKSNKRLEESDPAYQALLQFLSKTWNFHEQMTPIGQLESCFDELFFHFYDESFSRNKYLESQIAVYSKRLWENFGSLSFSINLS